MHLVVMLGNVTIFGQSGGGGKVSTLACHSFGAKDLFHKAIVQSGSMLRTMVAEVFSSHWQCRDGRTWSEGFADRRTLQDAV